MAIRDFFKPKWKNSKVKVRLEAVNNLDDQAILEKVAKTDTDEYIRIEAVKKLEEYVADALTKGGKLIMGGSRNAKGDCFFEPTIIADATHEMLPCQCEIFGPLAMISKFSSEEEVLEKANDTIHGLAAYFYSNDRARCWRMSEGLDAGIIGENTVAFSSARAPFGGFKQSGIGRDGGTEGLREWQEIKYRCIGGLD